VIGGAFFYGGEGNMKELIIGYFILINLTLLLVMKLDKNRAQHNRYRISEKTLWILALAGGAIGGTAGMQLFRHKTKHKAFVAGFPLLAIVDVIIAAILLSNIQS
jgi:uncharacterized membrane protein YsdA (DUF1294 family)